MGAVQEPGIVKWAWAAPCAAFLAVVGLSDGFGPASRAEEPPRHIAGLDAHETSASMTLLGQFRTNASAWLWLHTDLYLHNGVEMRALSEYEKSHGVTTMDPANDGHEQLYKESEVTSVPSPSSDFRGAFGDVDRQVSAYRDMHGHRHNDPRVAVPLFRLMTWVDPGFIQGWTTGAIAIARDTSPAGAEKALAFLNEGLAQNPEDPEILTEIAYLHISRLRDVHSAIPYLEKARQVGAKLMPTMDADEKSSFLQTYRWLALCYRDSGRLADSAATAREGIQKCGQDGVLDELAHPKPIISLRR